MIKPAIVVVGYDRPDSLSRLLLSLSNASYAYDGITLIISLDKSDIEEVVHIAEEFDWKHGKKVIRTFPTRQGLKQHILQCGDLSEKYGAVIVLEDDLYVAKDFYNFAVQAVNYYSNDERIAGIGLYSHEWNGYAHIPFQKRYGKGDVFAGQFSITWGQCWTDRQWNCFKAWLDLNSPYTYCEIIPERINRWSENSWGKFFAKYIAENGKFYIIPYVSMTTNFSDAGQHSQQTNTVHQVTLSERESYTYSFLPFNDLIKYDIFFEPVLDTLGLFGLHSEEIDIDLNQTRKRVNRNRYLLSTKTLPYHVIKSYSLSIRPAELNIIYGLQGEGIFLYDTSKKAPALDKRNRAFLPYFIRGFNFVQLFPFVCSNFWAILHIKMKLMKKKALQKFHN